MHQSQDSTDDLMIQTWFLWEQSQMWICGISNSIIQMYPCVSILLVLMNLDLSISWLPGYRLRVHRLQAGTVDCQTDRRLGSDRRQCWVQPIPRCTYLCLLCLCVYIYIYMFNDLIEFYICLCLDVCMHGCVCVCVCVYGCMFVFVYVFMCLLRTYIDTYIHTSIHTYIHTYIHTIT